MITASSIIIAALTLLALSSHLPARANVVVIKLFIIVKFLIINIVFMLIFYYFLRNSHAFHLTAHALVLVDEAGQRGILVANLPPLVNNNSHQHQYYDYHGRGEGYGENEAYVHLLFANLRFIWLFAHLRLQMYEKP
jgi:hypothetical protein